MAQLVISQQPNFDLFADADRMGGTLHVAAVLYVLLSGLWEVVYYSRRDTEAYVETDCGWDFELAKRKISDAVFVESIEKMINNARAVRKFGMSGR